MPIIFDEKELIIKLDTISSSYVMKIVRDNYLVHLYYGSFVDTTNLSYLVVPNKRGFSANPECDNGEGIFTLDTIPQEYPGFGIGDYRTSAIKIKHVDGTKTTDMRYLSHKIYNGKPLIKSLPATFANENEAETIEITMHDNVSMINVVLVYTVFNEHDIITRSAIVQNKSEDIVFLERVLSANIDFPHSDFDMIHLHGKWGMETQIERRKLYHGKQSIESLRGTSSHQHNPFVIMAGNNTSEDTGECYGFNLVYSSNFLIDVEVDQLDKTRLSIGINPSDFSWKLNKDEQFFTPEVVMSYSESGIGQLSRNFHDLYRNHLIRGLWKDKKRPIVINNWEATYFDFNADKLVEIAKVASECGIDMLVMDDGWFGKRDSDKSGLGDIFVNEKKLQCSLSTLIDRVNNEGVKFGIWIEPEMISPDSNLYREHEDWCIHVKNRYRSTARNQLVLDMSRKDVREYLFENICNILDGANIEYIKWDMNRHLTEVGSKILSVECQSEIYHRYILGTYELLDKITKRFPNILLEGCSGGGGRFDAGMLYYSPQYWTSDNTDAIDRLKIQYGTSLAYPISCISTHISASPNHQTLRDTSLETRGRVASAGTFGYELDITKMSQQELDIIKNQILEFKEIQSLIMFGDFYRLISPFESPNDSAWSFISKDKSQILVDYFLIKSDADISPKRLQIKGVDTKCLYKDDKTGDVYTGLTLQNIGLNIPLLKGDGISYRWKLTKI